MQYRNIIAVLLSCFFLAISLGLGACKSETTDKNDPQDLQRNEALEKEIKQERTDTTSVPNPIYVAGLGATNASEGETNATGELILTIQNDSAFIEGKFSGLSSDFTGAYLHEVLQSDRVRQLEPSLADDKRAGTIETGFGLDQEAKNLIKGDSLYISIYTTEFDNTGEISGQFTARDTIPPVPGEEN